MAWKEICWNIVNSLLAGALVFLGGVLGNNGTINTATLLASGITAFIVMITKFAEYWKQEESEYMDCPKTQSKLFNFLPIL
jgi:choline-glycine betaine transporter